MLVLFVDTDFEDYDRFCEALRISSPGTQCVHAKTGKEAFEILKDLALLPAYIFLDVDLPQSGCKQFCIKINSVARLKGIRIIIYSATPNEMRKPSMKV